MSAAAALAPTPFLQLRGIETFYGKIQALRGVDIDVNKGEIVTLIGANGAGKSTTMMTIFGAPRARRGRITFDGKDITNLPTHMISRLSIAQSPEGRRIFPRMTVLENLQMGASINKFAHFDQDLERVFALFPRLKERAPQRGGTLSGGEQQMLAIARALMSRPRLLLLDEPSLGLAPLVVKQIFEVIGELNAREGLTVFLVEQNAFHALKLAHRGYVMVNGAITMQGGGAELLARPEVRAAYLEGGPLMARHPLARRTLRPLHLRAHHAGARRGGRLGDRSGDGSDLAAVADARALYGVPHRRRALPSLRALRRAAAVADLFHYRLHLDDGGRRARLSLQARRADGDAIFMGL